VRFQFADCLLQGLDYAPQIIGGFAILHDNQIQFGYRPPELRENGRKLGRREGHGGYSVETK
jgi:hypothetical protein